MDSFQQLWETCIDRRHIFIGQLISQSTFNKPDFLATKEKNSTEDDSYMGYSVESLIFRPSNITGVAVGIPRGADLQGKVRMMLLIFLDRLYTYRKIYENIHEMWKLKNV